MLKTLLIGIVNDANGKLQGFRLFDLKYANKNTKPDPNANTYMDVPTSQAISAIRAGKVSVEGLTFDSTGKPSGTNGSLDRYPIVSAANNDKAKTNNPVIIVATIDDIGYIVVNKMGKVLYAPSSTVVAQAEKVGIANGKVVDKNGTKFISAINGTYMNIDAEKAGMANKGAAPKSEKKLAMEEKEKIEHDLVENIKRDYSRPFNAMYSAVDPKKSKFKQVIRTVRDENGHSVDVTVEQFLSSAIMQLRKTEPYLYAAYSAIKIIEANPEEIKTMAASVSNIYYSTDFIAEHDLGEITFVLIHELMHIQMGHRAREQGRNHRIWNQACDLYINKAIAENFAWNEGSITKTLVPGMSYTIPKGNDKIILAMPSEILYDPTVDIKNDTAESIYEKLLNKMQDNEMQNKKQQQGQQGQQGQGQGGEGGQGQNQQGQGGGSGSDGGEGEDGQGGAGAGGGSNGRRQIGKNDDPYSTNNGQGQGQGQGGYTPGIYDDDLVDDESTVGKASGQMISDWKSLVDRAQTLEKLQAGDKSIGNEQGLLARLIAEARADKVDWRKLLRKRLVELHKTICTYSKPDRRFLSRGNIIPGNKKIQGENAVEAWVCIDTSGSISDEELGKAFAQLKDMFKKFSVKARLFWWDTVVYPEKNEFYDIKDIAKLKPAGGGGTDINCVYAYIEDQIKTSKGRIQKPDNIIIFTDGYFGDTAKSYVNKFGKQTIFIINDNDKMEIPYGVVAKLKPED